MSTHYVRAPGQDYVVVIPRNTARDSRLSYRARGVLQRLLTNTEGFAMTAEDLAREGKEGRDAIRKALSELRDARYIIRKALTNATGRFVGSEAWVFNTPQADTPDRTPEKPLSGLPPVKSSKDSTEQESSSNPRAAAPDTSPGPAAGAERKRRQVHASTGAVFWYRDEVAVLDQLVVEFGLDSVRAAVSALLEKGADPLPTPLASVLLGHRFRSSSAAAPTNRQRERTAEDYAADAEAAARWLADLEGDRS